MTSRREFLKAAGVAPALVWAAQCSRAGMAANAEGSELPQIAFGKHHISRLVCGANPFNGGSHLSGFVNREMKSYYTPEQILKTLRRCEEVGITCWQAGTGNSELYRRHVNEGGKMRFLVIESNPQHIAALAAAGTIGVAHHGESTDHLFKSGQIDKVADFLKRVKDAGLMAGVSTHMPAVVDTIESKGWDLDYYMTCVYERHRTQRGVGEASRPGPVADRGSIPRARSAADVQGDSAHQAALPGVQDPGRRPALGPPRMGRTGVSRRLPVDQAR